jgi:NO-binding membrane sensor protein with MHYT domain
MNTITISYDLTLIGLSYLISVFGAYTALQLAIGIPAAEGKSMMGWLAGAALAMGGGAIWSMHFLGMLAYEVNMPVAYDPMITFISAIIAVTVTAVGLFIVGRGAASLAKLVLGGIFTGLGVAGMHYTGMAAMIMPAALSYDPTLFGLSIVIAVVAATVALWLAFNLRGNMQRFGSAIVMGAAVCGMHYTGMAAAILKPTGEANVQSGFGISAQQLGIYVFALAVVLLTVILFVGMSRSRQLLELEE